MSGSGALLPFGSHPSRSLAIVHSTALSFSSRLRALTSGSLVS